MAEFNLHESLKNAKPQEEKSPEDRLKAQANDAYRHTMDAFNINGNYKGEDYSNIAEREDLMSGWDRVIGVSRRAKEDVFRVLEQSQTSNTYAQSGFEQDIWRSRLANSTIDAIRTGNNRAEVSFTVLSDCDKILENMSTSLLGGKLDGQDVPGELVRQQEELQEAKNANKLWSRIKTRVGRRVQTIPREGVVKATGGTIKDGATSVGNGVAAGLSAAWRHKGKIAIAGLAAGPKGLLIGGAALFAGHKVLENKQDRYKGKLQETITKIRSEIKTFKSEKEKEIARETHIFTASFNALSPDEKAELKNEISEEIKGTERGIDKTNDIRAISGATQAIGRIPYSIRLEIYKQLGLDQTNLENAIDQLSDNFEAQVSDIDERKQDIETTEIKNINFKELIKGIESRYTLEELEAPETGQLINNILDGLPSNLQQRIRALLQVKHGPEEQFLHLCAYLDSIRSSTTFATVMNALTHKPKAQLLAYLKKLDSDSRNDYQQLGTPEEKESLELAKEYHTAASSIVTDAKKVRKVENLKPDETFKVKIKGKDLGIEGILDYFNDDKSEYSEHASDEWNRVENTLKSLQSEYNKWKEVDKKLKEYNKWKTNPKHGQKPKQGDFPKTQTINNNNGSSVNEDFDSTAYNNALRSWITEMGGKEHLEEPDMPETNWDRIEAGLEKITAKLNEKGGTKKEAPKGNVRMYRRLYKQAEKAFEDEYLQNLKSKQKYQFENLTKLTEETSLEELKIQESNPSFPINRTEMEKNQLNVVNPRIYKVTEDKKAVIIKGTVNGTNGLIVLQQPEGDLSKPNAAFYAETSLISYDASNPEPDHFQFPDQPNFAAISLNIKAS